MNDRKLDVLRTIVSNYVNTGEPVSSKAVAASHDLRVSTATIRNDMGVLEREGLIYQPHTSAGRVPTEAGYRHFVDRLSVLQPLTEPQKRAIGNFLDGAVDFEDVITRAVRYLASLTRSAAVVEVPPVGASTLRRVDVIDLDPQLLLILAVSSAGQVQERRVGLEVPLEVTPEMVGRLREHSNAAAQGGSHAELVDGRADLIAKFPPTENEVAAQIIDVLIDMMSDQTQSRFVVAGMSNLARADEDFDDVSRILDALEEQVVLMRLFHNVHEDPVQISIGAENQTEPLDQASVISGTYQVGPEKFGHLGIVGPTRMDYPRSLVAVEAVSRYLSGLLLD